MFKGSDRFLSGIVAGAVLLVIVVVVVVLIQPEPTYLNDGSPESVAHNYLLALSREDYEEAFNCLSAELPWGPESSEALAKQVRDNAWYFSLRVDENISLSVESSRIRSDGQAVVTVRQVNFNQGGLLDSSQSASDFDLYLAQEAAGWRVVDADSYWNDCWSNDHSWCDH